MAYGSKIKGIPSEMASKIGHLSVIEDEFVQQMLDSFQITNASEDLKKNINVQIIKPSKAATKVICVDGSFTVVPHALKDHKKLAYIKIAALGLNIDELEKANKVVVDPKIVQKITSEYATTQSTVLPLENITIPGKTLKETLRKAIYLSFQKLFDGKLLSTLVYLVGRGWLNGEHEIDAHFACPFCGIDTKIPKSQIEFSCDNKKCKEKLNIVDYLAFLTESAEDQSDDKVARDVMLMMEHLTLIYYLKELNDNGENLEDYLILKDGPLLLSGQYSRLVDPIREYLYFLKSSGKSFNFIGVEKSGTFFNHVSEVKTALDEVDSVFIPTNHYIFEKIKYSASNDTEYGNKVLYGSKLFYSPDGKRVFVLTIPIGLFKIDAKVDDFIGLSSIAATFKRIVSHRYDNALTPIIAVNSVASMSYYPSNNILSRFTDHYITKK